MAICDVCGEGFRGGSANVGKWTFCTHQCRDKGKDLQALEEFPDAIISGEIIKARNAGCPECGQASTIDVHKSHRAHSVVIWTTWQSHSHICCRRCARSHQWKAVGYTAALGWWGLPWGFIASPIQIGRNLVAMLRNSDQPSFDFVRTVRLNLARAVADSNARTNRGRPPPPSEPAAAPVAPRWKPTEKVRPLPPPPPPPFAKAPARESHGFKIGEHVVYPAHGVGRIMSIEDHDVAGSRLQMFVIHFKTDQMTLHVPTANAAKVGLRRLADEI
jgi:hypothetical protein